LACWDGIESRDELVRRADMALYEEKVGKFGHPDRPADASPRSIPA
jgi:hypothetical protein